MATRKDRGDNPIAPKWHDKYTTGRVKGTPAQEAAHREAMRLATKTKRKKK